MHALPRWHAPQLNYASDEKPTKDVARKMIQMVMHINDEHLKGIGPATVGATGERCRRHSAEPEKVTCFTCHRGRSSRPPRRPPAGGN